MITLKFLWSGFGGALDIRETVTEDQLEAVKIKQGSSRAKGRRDNGPEKYLSDVVSGLSICM